MNDSEMYVTVIRGGKGRSKIYEHVTDVVIKDGVVTIDYRIGEHGSGGSSFPLSSMISINGVLETVDKEKKKRG